MIQYPQPFSLDGSMLDGELHFHELTGLDDALLPAWLDLYETSFAPAERLLVSFYLRLLKAKDDPQNRDHHILAAVDRDSDRSGCLGGIVHYRLSPTERMAALWYLAVRPDLRGKGLGSSIYRALLERFDPASFDLLLFEVEIPEEQAAPADCRTAQRRIGFYQRHGAQLLDGIHYTQVVGPHQPPIPMHLMVHLLNDLSPSQVFEKAKGEFGEYLTRCGELALIPEK